MASSADSAGVQVRMACVARVVPWLFFACVATACGLGYEVEQEGSYVIVPPTAVTDSAPYPLQSLLHVQRDEQLAQTRLYLFRGELRKADLGLEDLRRILARRNGFQMAFDAAPRRFESDTVKSHGKSLAARVEGEAVDLARLDDAGLKESGAERYLASVSTPDYDIAAYFGVWGGDSPEPAIGIARAGIEYAPEVAAPALALELDRDAMKLGLKYDTSADFLVVELVQPIQEHMEEGETDGAEDGAEKEDAEDAADTTIDALVRTTLDPTTDYVVTSPMLTDVAGKGCWSRERPIQARLHEVWRQYTPQAQGDWAVVYERVNSLEIGVEDWTALLGDPKPASYCDDFE